MSNQLIEIGRNKVINSGMRYHLDDTFPEKILEILGATKAEYYGRAELSHFQTDADLYQYKFYRYDNLELIECSYGNASSTTEFKSDRVFIFSQEPEETVEYYVAEIV